jgi:uncharacterized protein YndB with AHSA1/START domain
VNSTIVSKGSFVKRLNSTKTTIMMTKLTDEKALTTKNVFSRETIIRTTIKADASIIWALLTNANDYARWNSTIVSLEGEIKTGGKIKLKSTLDAKREFKLSVKEFEAGRSLVWGDAMGKRTFTLSDAGTNSTLFTMHEKIGGPIFPLIARMIPSFDESFETFARDLKKEAEAIQSASI